MSTLNDQSSKHVNQVNTQMDNRQLAELTQYITNLTVLIEKMGGKAEEAAKKLQLDQVAEQFNNLSVLLKNDLNSATSVLQNLDSEWRKTGQEVDSLNQKLSVTVKSGVGKALLGALTFDRNAMKAGFNEAKDAIAGYGNDMASTANQSLKNLGNAGTAIWANLKKGADDVSGFFKEVSRQSQQTFREIVDAEISKNKKVIQDLDSEWQKTVQEVDSFKQKLSDTAKGGLGKAVWGVFTFDKNAMKAGFDEAKNAVAGYMDEMTNTVKQSVNTLGKAGTAIWDNIKKGAQEVSNFFKGGSRQSPKSNAKIANPGALKNQQLSDLGKEKFQNSKGLQQLNKENKSELNSAKKNASEKNKIAESAAKQKTKILQKEEKKQQKDVLTNINNGLSASKNMVNNLSGMFSQYYSLRSQAIDIQYNQEKQRILDSTMNEEEKKKALDALDADTQKKKKELAKEQAETNKTVGIFNAVIDTAQGIAAALKAGWPQCIAFAAAAAAQGAAQIAVIKSQQIPALASGGIITSKGMALVGEQGPELVTLPEAASVIPLTRPQLSTTGVGGFGTANITLEIDGRTLVKQLGTPLRDMIRIKTGLK